MHLPSLLRHVAVDIREIATEAVTHGGKAGWTCFQAHLENFNSLVQERFGRSRGVSCPCCGWSGHRFRALFVADCVLPNVECPQCTSHNRQRLLHVWLSRGAGRDLLARGAAVLHVAPELHLRRILQNDFDARIVSVDLMPDKLRKAGGRTLRTDLQQAGLRDASFDLAICIHVLEHIPDDRAAVAELHRVLRPGGLAIFMVPMNFWSPEIIEYGGANPRMYGHWRDYVPQAMAERLRPFDTELIRPEDWLSEQERDLYGIVPQEIIFLCRRDVNAGA